MKIKWTKNILKSQYKCIAEFLDLINVLVIANGVFIILYYIYIVEFFVFELLLKNLTYVTY